MQSDNHIDNDRVIDELLITREYIHQVSDSLHQQIWEARRLANETRFIVGIVFWLVCLMVVIICWNFIVAILAWLAGFALLAYKIVEPTIESITRRDIQHLVFWSVLIFIAGFLTIFLFRASQILLKAMWTGSQLQTRAKKILNKLSSENKQTELADVQNKKVDAEKIARAQRMNEYRQEAENFLNKNKEAKFKV
jgi:predicted membrane protein